MQIKNILIVVDSSYLKRFEDLTSNIKAGSIEAHNILLFLKILSETCKKFYDWESPKQISVILSKFLIKVRNIWKNQNFIIQLKEFKDIYTKFLMKLLKDANNRLI